MDKSAPIPAFCSSDEEEEEKDALMYLPIAPEIEDPEENWVPGVDPPPDEESPLGASKRSSNSNLDFKENTSPKKKRTKTTDIFLQNYPKDGKYFLFTLAHTFYEHPPISPCFFTSPYLMCTLLLMMSFS